MKKKLSGQALFKFTAGVLVIGSLLFGCAGTFAYWQGWLLMAILFISMFLAGLVLLAKNPKLLERRLHAKEEQPTQSTLIQLSGLMFVAAFSCAGLGIRFGWIQFPAWISWLGALLFLAAYGLYAEVLRENTWLSRTIEVQDGQQVVDSGLYGIVRHPMYAVTLLLFLFMPLVLGSPFAFLVLLLYPVLIARRIQNEEQVLERELTGYREYKTRIRYRLIPYFW